jgi:hypothetical protein
MTAVDVHLDHLETAAWYAAHPDSWPVAPRFSPTARWYHRLAREADHEVWLLTWLPGQGTDLHDHGGSAGALHVVSGVLVEDTVTQTHALPSRVTPRMTVRELSAGIGRRFGARHIHRITNRSDRPAVSVHVYGPALTSMTRYRIGPGGLDVVAVEKAGVQW